MLASRHKNRTGRIATRAIPLFLIAACSAGLSVLPFESVQGQTVRSLPPSQTVSRLPEIPETAELQKRIKTLQKMEQSKKSQSIHLPNMLPKRARRIVMPLPSTIDSDELGLEITESVEREMKSDVPEIPSLAMSDTTIEPELDELQITKSEVLPTQQGRFNSFGSVSSTNPGKPTPLKTASERTNSVEKKTGLPWPSHPIDQVPVNIDPRFIPQSDQSVRESASATPKQAAPKHVAPKRAVPKQIESTRVESTHGGNFRPRSTSPETSPAERPQSESRKGFRPAVSRIEAKQDLITRTLAKATEAATTQAANRPMNSVRPISIETTESNETIHRQVAFQEPTKQSSKPVVQTARPTRHPLATTIARQQQEQPGSPATPAINAPYRSVLDEHIQQRQAAPPVTAFQPPQQYQETWQPAPGNGSGEIDLVQPPSPENQLRHQTAGGPPPAPQSGKQFWSGFSTFPDNKKERTDGYDSMQAVLRNGFWYAGVDAVYVEPMYQENNAFVTTSGVNASAAHVDFGFDLAFRGYFGFETNAGPAFKASFFRLNNFSSINAITIGAGQTAVTTIDLGDSDNQIFLGQAAGAGSRLTVQQQLKINSSEFLIYKDQKNPISRVRGNIGLRQISLQQLLFAGLNDPSAGSQVARNFNDYFGAGPKIGIEYFRPIGHTDLEMQSGFFGSLLFGRRDQIFDLAGAAPVRFEQLGKVEAVSIFEMYLGVQWNLEISKCQHVFLRSAVESQLWAGSDSALDVGSDFGLYGMSFSCGITR